MFSTSHTLLMVYYSPYYLLFVYWWAIKMSSTLETHCKNYILPFVYCIFYYLLSINWWAIQISSTSENFCTSHTLIKANDNVCVLLIVQGQKHNILMKIVLLTIAISNGNYNIVQSKCGEVNVRSFTQDNQSKMVNSIDVANKLLHKLIADPIFLYQFISSTHASVP